MQGNLRQQACGIIRKLRYDKPVKNVGTETANYSNCCFNNNINK